MASNEMREDAFLGERRRLMSRIVWILAWVAAAHVAVLAILAMVAL